MHIDTKRIVRVCLSKTKLMTTAEEHNEAPPRLIPSSRFTLALLVCFGLFNQYSQRLSMSIAIVCMVNRTDISTTPTKIGTNLFKEKQFQWTELEQQLILGAYWAGYILSLVPGKIKYSFLETYALNILRWLVVNQNWCKASVRLFSIDE